MIEHVPSNCFITRFRAAVSVLVGPRCPALPNCIDANVHTVYYNIAANKMMMTMMMICCKVADRHAVFRRRGHACYTTMNPLAAVSGGLPIRKNRQLPKARHGAGARPVHCDFFIFN